MTIVQGRIAWTSLGVLFVATCLALTVVHLGAMTVRPHAPLTHIPAILLHVTTSPNPQNAPPLSITELERAIRTQLKDAGIILKDSWSPGVPFLNVDIDSAHVGTQYVYTVTVDLEERCRVERLDISGFPCKTWFMEPSMGVFSVGDEAKLRKHVLDSVKLFSDFWKADNVRPDV